MLRDPSIGLGRYVVLQRVGNIPSSGVRGPEKVRNVDGAPVALSFISRMEEINRPEKSHCQPLG